MPCLRLRVAPNSQPGADEIVIEQATPTRAPGPGRGPRRAFSLDFADQVNRTAPSGAYRRRYPVGLRLVRKLTCYPVECVRSVPLTFT